MLGHDKKQVGSKKFEPTCLPNINKNHSKHIMEQQINLHQQQFARQQSFHW